MYNFNFLPEETNEDNILPILSDIVGEKEKFIRFIARKTFYALLSHPGIALDLLYKMLVYCLTAH